MLFGGVFSFPWLNVNWFPERGYDQSTLKRDDFSFFLLWPCLIQISFLQSCLHKSLLVSNLPIWEGRLELFCVPVYTYTHNPVLASLLSRTNKELEFFLLFLYFFFVSSSHCCLWTKTWHCAIPIIFSGGFSPPVISLLRVSMVQISLSFVKFGSARN